MIADAPLDRYVPLEEAAKGIVCTQFEMRAVEAVGLVKIDLLGNRAISTIQETVELVAAEHGVRLDPDAFPHEDAETATLMSSGDTLGVFQMESPGMRSLNRMLATRDLATAIAAVALIRPGPAASGMKERFCRRARGLEPVDLSRPATRTGAARDLRRAPLRRGRDAHRRHRDRAHAGGRRRVATRHRRPVRKRHRGDARRVPGPRAAATATAPTPPARSGTGSCSSAPSRSARRTRRATAFSLGRRVGSRRITPPSSRSPS